MTDRNIALRTEGIGKIYRIGMNDTASDSLAGAMIDVLTSPIKNYRKYRSLYKFDDVDIARESNTNKDPSDIIWALSDVSFSVNEGEVVGIIGRNGAGKSTLLKILSRITPPTRGRAEIHGRVSSLLEVGTGFHQELTGRENVYLNGTILGMKKQEVDRKFDEIVAFSGVERFLDTPVKRYSDGMAVRLAFSVAAHLEPEILIIDEVLAVGDAAFQKKCINKMQDVGKHGRTVLFVSHNMPAITTLCSRAILLNNGGIVRDGAARDVVNAYLSTGIGIPTARLWHEPHTAPGGEVARLYAVRVVLREGEVLESVDIRREVGIEMVYDVISPGFSLLPHYCLHNEAGQAVFETLDQDPNWRHRPRPKGRYVSAVWIPGNFLAEGMLFVTCALITRRPDIAQFYEQQVIAFNVTDHMGDDTARGDWAGELDGVVRPLLPWETQFEQTGPDE